MRRWSWPSLSFLQVPPSGDYTEDNICVLRICIIVRVIAFGSREILFTLIGEFTCKFFKSFLLFAAAPFYIPQSSGGERNNRLGPNQPSSTTNHLLLYATILFCVRSRQICLNSFSRSWTSNFQLSFIESETTKRLEPDPVRRILMRNGPAFWRLHR